MALSRGSRGRRALILVSYLALLVASYYPISTEPWGHVTFIGDSLESAYIVAWNAHQVLADPWHLYDANILFPQARALAFTDHRFLPSALAAPVLWISGNPILAFNAAVAIGLLLAAFGARRLALGVRVLADPPTSRTVTFLPQGLSSGAHLLVEGPGRRAYLVTVDPLTGRVATRRLDT